MQTPYFWPSEIEIIDQNASGGASSAFSAFKGWRNIGELMEEDGRRMSVKRK